MRLAIGFCAAFLNSSAFDAAAGVSSVATCVPSGPTGVSCAKSGDVDIRKPASASKPSLILTCDSLEYVVILTMSPFGRHC